MTSLLKDPQSAWENPAITTHGFRNHAIRNDDWRYIRYANGDEELYHSKEDPLEYKNLAKLPEHAQIKANLARWLPTKDAPNLPMTDESVNKKGEKKKVKKPGKVEAR